MRARTPALKTMTAAEKAELLDALLADQPALRDRAEALAVARMSDGNRAAVAQEVESALRGLDIDQLNGRAGYRRGVGYVDPGDAADELLDEALQPFLDDLARRGRLGMTTAAAECAVGIPDGLYRCREGGSESLLEFAPDYVIERASDVVARCGALGLDLPVDDLVELLPEWAAVLRPRGHPADPSYVYTCSSLSVFWPEAEFHALIARWPHLADHLGTTWDEHRRRVERHCALCERSGLRVEQLPADVPGFEAFLAGRGVTCPEKDDLLAHPDLRSVTTAMLAWPPARTAACWCGSGRKYKQCCRRHGLGELD